MKRVFLHIGFGKTGTTSIQTALYYYRAALYQQLIWYPMVNLVGGHHSLCMLGVDHLPTRVHETWRQLFQQFRSIGQRSLVISSENCSFLRNSAIQQIHALAADLPTSIVLYVRPQAELIESAYKQRLRMGQDTNGDIREFFAKHKASFNFERIVGKWSMEFGDDAIIARVHDSQSKDYNAVTDFSEVIGARLAPRRSQIRSNPSILPDFVPLIRIIDECAIGANQRNRIIDEISRCSRVLGDCSSQKTMDEELRQQILEHYRRSNESFAQRFLNPEQRKILLR